MTRPQRCGRAVPARAGTWALIAWLAAVPAAARAAAAVGESGDAEVGGEASAVAARPEAAVATGLNARIPPVSQRLVPLRGRFALDLGVGLSANEAFYRYVLPRLALQWHILDPLAVGLELEYAAAVTTTPSVVGSARPPSVAINHPVGGARLLVRWTPIYGKMSWLAEGVTRFDTALTLGLGAMLNSQGGAVPAATLAIGQRYFFTPSLALNLELREAVFNLPRGAVGGALQGLLSVHVGATFLLGAATPAQGA